MVLSASWREEHDEAGEVERLSPSRRSVLRSCFAGRQADAVVESAG
jgi:hypothetical protein